MVEGVDIPSVAKAMQKEHEAIEDQLLARDGGMDDSPRGAAHPLHHRRNPELTEATAPLAPVADAVVEHMLEMAALAVVDFLMPR